MVKGNRFSCTVGPNSYNKAPQDAHVHVEAYANLAVEKLSVRTTNITYIQVSRRWMMVGV
jgi:uncharacterized protein YdbL (DUF1318 family)